jgi:hypothetical protein
VEFSWWDGRKLTATRQALRVVLALSLARVSRDARGRAAPALSATLSVCWTLGYSGADQGGERDRLEQHVSYRSQFPDGFEERVKSFGSENVHKPDKTLIEHFYKPYRRADASLTYRLNHPIAAASTERHDRGARLSVAHSSREHSESDLTCLPSK